jgi:hypothetical protein
VHDAEHEKYTILGNDVVHDSIVADAEPMERVGPTLNGSHLFGANAAGFPRCSRKLLEASGESLPNRVR